MTPHSEEDDLGALARRLVVEPGVSPAAVLGVAVSARDGWRYLIGAAGRRSAAHPEAVDPRTPFDLASVTKPFVACTAARLVRRRVLAWTCELGEILPELADTRASQASLEALLSHRAGLEAHRPLYRPLLEGRRVDGAQALREAANAVRAECGGKRPKHGFSPVYSDLGYLLAGAALSRAGGSPLSDLVDGEVSGPLGLDVASSASWRARDPTFLDRVAPTEVVPFRGGEITGEVHDENAWAVSGLSISGHAGLFGTARSVLDFGASVIDALAGGRVDWLRPEEVEPLVRVRPGGTLRAGFDGRAEEGSAAGSRFGPRSFGHLGFTGTSLWCDPDGRIVSVILTNRVNPSRDNVAIRQVRPALGDALYRAADALRAGDRPGSWLRAVPPADVGSPAPLVGSRADARKTQKS